MRSTFRSLSIPNFRLYVAGGIVSNVGTWMQRVAQAWLILVLTDNSGTALGVTTGLQFLPILLLSAPAGVIADRVPKRRLLQVTQLVMAAPGLALGLLAVTGVAQAWHVFVLAFLFGVGTAIDGPARQSFVSEMVGPADLTNAVGLNSASFNVARIVGPAAAGLLIGWFGSGAEAAGWVILLSALGYGAVVATLGRLDPLELDAPALAPHRRGMVREAVGYVRGRPDLMLVMAVAFFAGTFGSFQLTSALMTTQVFGKGAEAYGILGTTVAVGSIIGSLLVARRATSTGGLVVVSAVAFGVTEVVAGVMPTYLTFLLWTPVLGLAALTMMTAANATVQLGADPAYRGRVMALYLTVFMGGMPFGSLLVGWIGEEFGARWTLVSGGTVTILGVVFAVAFFARWRPVVADRIDSELAVGPGMVGRVAP